MYDRPMTVAHPGCVLFLIDQSGSMSIEVGAHSNAERVADALNRLLSGLVARCRDGDQVRDHLLVGAIGYGGSGGNGLGEDLLGTGWRGCRPISRLRAGRPGVLVPGPADGLGRLVKRRPWPLQIWLDPVAYFSTAMCTALRRAGQLCQDFVEHHPDSYPPIVVNLTDGQATDGNPRKPAGALRSISSRHGAVLLFNLHVSGGGGEPVEFPAEPPLHDSAARKLFEMSSVLPARMRAAAARLRRPLPEGARGFAYDAPASSLARLLDIGLPASLLPTRRR